MDQKLLYLSQKDVADTGLSMAKIIDAIEKAFVEYGHDRIEMPPKPGIHPGEGGENYIHAMPAFIPAIDSAGMKWVSGYPPNQAKGLPYNAGILVLNDPWTGLVYAIMDCAWITGYRTGAASALSAKYLARKDSEKVGILACGLQGKTNLIAMKTLFPVKEAYLFDLSRERAKSLEKFAVDELGIQAQVVSDPKEAVVGMDIVVTSGPILKKPHETLQADWIDPGTFLSLVDFDSYLTRAALNKADKWTTDHLGQYNYYKDVAGYFQNCPDIHADLGELATGKKAHRQTAEEITMAANLGAAIEDMAVAPLIYKQAKEKGIGVWLDL